MIGLYIGRFQPFHLGHYSVVSQLLEKVDTLNLGVGSSQYKNTLENPFDFEERKEMIEQSFYDRKEFLGRLKIVAIPDLHDDCVWVDHVLSITGDVDITFANDTWVNRLFCEKNITVEQFPFFDRKRYSGTRVRKKIVENKTWQDLVPKAVVDIIYRIDGVKRIKELYINSESDHIGN